MTSAALIAAFGPKIDDPSLLNKCAHLMKIYSLSADDLFLKWESYCLTHATSEEATTLTPENLDLLQGYVQQALERTLQSASKPKVMMRPVSSPSQMFDLPSTPSTLKRRKLESPLKREALGLTTPTRNTPRSSNLNSSPIKQEAVVETPTRAAGPESGTILETLNPTVDAAPGAHLEHLQVRVVPQFDGEKYKFRTMRQKLLEAADVLDDQIDTFAQIIQKSFNLNTEDFKNPTMASHSDHVCVGRIVPDLPLTDAAQLNRSSLFLETSRLGGVGKRVSLDVSPVADYAFFAGQVVALRGKNPTGETFIVTEVLELPYLGAPAVRAGELAEVLALQEEGPLKVVVCAGPYTLNANLDFTALRTFATALNETIRPHAVLFLGPFVDITHPLIADGSLEVEGAYTLDDVFRLVVTPILRSVDPKIQVVVIPSTKDAASKHSAYPQDALDRKLLQLPKAIKSYPNPAHFAMNEIHVGVSNNDVFRDLRDVTHGKYATQNRFDRVAAQVIQQRRYYPVFPGGIKQLPDGTHISGADLDMPYMGLSEMGDVTPDILIIPSEMRYFAKVVKNVVVINPGWFMRPGSHGSYAVISIAPPVALAVAKVGTGVNEETGETEELFVSQAWSRTRVDIVKV